MKTLIYRKIFKEFNQFIIIEVRKMGFLKLIDKKNVPDELPALITDEIKKKSEETKAQDINKEISEPKPENLPEEEIKQEIKDNAEQKTGIEKNQDNQAKDEIQIKKDSIPKEKINDEKNYSKLSKDSFFINMQENLNKEMGSLNKLEEWYNTKLLPEDTLSEMKNYWEKQKSSSMIQALGKDFQDKITKKISLLQDLEKGWQGIYFNLIEKEEEIKEQERELKKMLAEFIGFCKKRVKNEKTKERKETPNKKRKSR